GAPPGTTRGSAAVIGPSTWWVCAWLVAPPPSSTSSRSLPSPGSRLQASAAPAVCASRHSKRVGSPTDPTSVTRNSSTIGPASKHSKASSNTTRCPSGVTTTTSLTPTPSPGAVVPLSSSPIVTLTLPAGGSSTWRSSPTTLTSRRGAPHTSTLKPPAPAVCAKLRPASVTLTPPATEPRAGVMPNTSTFGSSEPPG